MASVIGEWAYLYTTVALLTGGDIIQASDKWLNVPLVSINDSRARHPKNEQLEDALFLWFNDVHFRCCDNIMKEKG